MDNNQSVDPTAQTLTKAIAMQEGGGSLLSYDHASGDEPNAPQGTAGGRYQFTGATWKNYAQQVLGSADAPMTPENQNKVAYTKIKGFLDAGNTPAQAASMWNAGEGSPDSWKPGTKQAHGDTPTYVKNVQKYAQQLSQGQSNSKGQSSQTSSYPVNSLQVPAGVDTQSQPQDATGQGSFIGDASQTIGQAGTGVGNAVNDTMSGKINPLSGVLQVGGAIAGGVSGLVNNVATHLPVVGGAVQGAENLIGQGIGAAAQTAPGQAVTGAVNQFSQAHPELAGDIGAAGNIAGLATGLIGGGEAGIAAKEGLASAAAKGLLGDTVKAASDKAAFNEALDIVSPKQTAGVLKKGIKAGRGAMQGGVETVGPDQQTIAAAKAAAGIVKKGNTAVENANAVRGAIGDTASGLKKELGSMEITPIVSQDELLQLRTQAMQQIGENPTMVGNAEESAKRIFTKFQSLLPQTSDVTALDVLEARQKLDAWIQSLKGSNIFDPATENAMSIALRSIRQGANKLIADKAPGVAVKDALAKQSSLYDALDNIAAKGTKDIGTGRIKRFSQRHPIVSGLVKTGARYATMGAGFHAAADLIP
jgi:hypothetical protein